MRHGAAQDRNMQRVGHGQIVDEAALAAQQRAVLDPHHAPTDELTRWAAEPVPVCRFHVV
jgi:hypothetical protein